MFDRCTALNLPLSRSSLLLHVEGRDLHGSQAAQSYPVLLMTLYLYINSILKIIRKSCVINLLRYIFILVKIFQETHVSAFHYTII